MAKVTLPLMSLAAEGSVGGALVFGRLKGQNVVRILVTPANPKTVGQTAQRDKLSGAVSEWHVSGLTAADIEAYNRWASASFRKMSGYNLFTSQRIKYKQQGGDEAPAFDVEAVGGSAVDIDIEFQFVAGSTAEMYVGTTKTSQPSKFDMVDDGGGDYSGSAIGLSASTTYYFYLKFIDPDGDYYRSGLYTAETTA